ncbi:MAG: glycosyltransferase family 2 protein [Actinomycetota bacterium]
MGFEMEEPGAQTRLAIVIVNWNGADLLTACLQPLVQGDCEVIVVDNGSKDSSLALLEESFPTVTVIANPDNRGFAVANNQGLRLTTAPAVLLLNNDTIPDTAALAQLSEFLEHHPRAGVVGPTLVSTDGSPQPSCGPGPNIWTEVLGKSLLHRLVPGLRSRAPSATCQVDWVTGAALCIRRELALELGGLDEAMFMFYEDLELCARVREAGQEVWFVATTPIVHIGGASRRRAETESLLHSYESTGLFFARHGPRWRHRLIRVLTVPEMMVRIGVWSALFVARSRRGLARERLRAYRKILRMACGGL